MEMEKAARGWRQYATPDIIPNLHYMVLVAIGGTFVMMETLSVTLDIVDSGLA